MNDMFSVSILSIILGAVAYFIIGFLAHGPVFGKLWMRLANIYSANKPKMSDMYEKMAWNIVANILSALVIAIIATIISSSLVFSITALWAGILSAVLVWIIIVASSAMEVVWMGKRLKLWLFEIANTLVGFLAIGIIVGLF